MTSSSLTNFDAILNELPVSSILLLPLSLLLLMMKIINLLIDDKIISLLIHDRGFLIRSFLLCVERGDLSGAREIIESMTK